MGERKRSPPSISMLIDGFAALHLEYLLRLNEVWMHRFLCACAVLPIAMGQGALAIDRVAHIESVHSGKCLDVPGFSTDPEAPVIQYSCTGDDNQKWRIRDRGNGVHEIVAAHSLLCLDVLGASMEDVAPIIQYPCNGQANQGFRIVETDGRVTIVSDHSLKCLDIEGGVATDGARLIQYACSGQPNQQFRLK